MSQISKRQTTYHIH